MGDVAIAEAIAQGDLGAVGTAFDKYGQELYDYCQSQLGDVTDAAEVVEATFVIAAARASLLRNPERLRAWLFAIARCACHQQLEAGAKPAYLDDMTGVWDWEQLAGGSVWQADLLSSAWTALAAMNPRDREIAELTLRHGLDPAELADVLGVTRSRARTLAQSSRAQFEASEDLLLASCPEQPWSCGTAADHLNGMDGDLTRVSPRWMKGHASNCGICAKRGRRNPGAAVVLALLPSAGLPANERQRLMWLLSDDSTDTAAYRGEVAERVEPFGVNGFPGKAASQVGRRRGSYVMAACAAALAVVLLGAGAVLVDEHTSNQNGPAPAAGAPAPSASTQSGKTNSSGHGKSSQKGVVAGPNIANNTGNGTSSTQPGKAKSSASPKPTTKKSTSPTPTTTPTPKPTPTPTPTPSLTPSPTPTGSPSASPSASSSDASLVFSALFGGL